jgi:hypothetical protein
LIFLAKCNSHLPRFQDVDASKQALEQASALYDRATNGILKKSMLLHFAYADFEEQQMKFDKVQQIYQKYLEIEDVDPTLVRAISKTFWLEGTITYLQERPATVADSVTSPSLSKSWPRARTITI